MSRLFLSVVAAVAAGMLAGCFGPYDPWHGDYAPNYRPAAGDGFSLDYNDRVYRDEDGGYYCARSDGSLGLVVMGEGGAMPPELVWPGWSRKLGDIVTEPGARPVREAIEAHALRCV